MPYDPGFSKTWGERKTEDKKITQVYLGGPNNIRVYDPDGNPMSNGELGYGDRLKLWMESMERR